MDPNAPRLGFTGGPGRSLLGHPFAQISVTEPPRSRMVVVLTMVHNWAYWQDAEAMDERPPPLLIENVDGRPISLAQLITKLYDYTIGLRDLIYEIEDREASDNAHLYFSGLSGPKRRDPKDVDALFRVHVSSDIVKDDPMNEEMWAGKAQRFAAKHHSSS